MEWSRAGLVGLSNAELLELTERLEAAPPPTSLADAVTGIVEGRALGLAFTPYVDGEVLEALQELTRLAVQTRTGERSRLMLDIAGYRRGIKEKLSEQARAAIARVNETGESVSLDPMNPFERKVVHDVVKQAGLTSGSEGVEPRRHVVIRPASD